MKKLIQIFLIICTVYSCAPKNNSETAIHKLKLLYDAGKPETLGDGTIFYQFSPTVFRHDSLIYLNPYIAAKKIKGCFDQGLGILPKRQVLGKYSRFNDSIFDLYEWESLTDEVKMEQHLHKFTNASGVSFCESDFYLECKIWITKK